MIYIKVHLKRYIHGNRDRTIGSVQYNRWHMKEMTLKIYCILIFKDLIFTYKYVCVPVGKCPQRTEKRHWSSLRAGVTGKVLSCLVWMLGTKLWYSLRAICILNC